MAATPRAEVARPVLSLFPTPLDRFPFRLPADLVAEVAKLGRALDVEILCFAPEDAAAARGMGGIAFVAHSGHVLVVMARAPAALAAAEARTG
jgi:hypothetical protein